MVDSRSATLGDDSTAIMIRRLWKFNGGVHPPQHKIESTNDAVTTGTLPKRLTLPLHQHIGEAADPVVKVGDKVLKGQLIARATGYVSSPVHAPSSGTIVDIDEYPIPHPSGLNAQCIVIDTDGLDEWADHTPVENFRELSPSALRNTIREAGIVGLGGAGFPSYIKLNPGHDKGIKTLILNGVECEPYITCDDMLMRERPKHIVEGLRIARHALHAEECIIAIEDNKPEAFKSLTAAASKHDYIHVVQVPTLYPQGSEKQLVKVLTGKEVPSNGLCLHVGVVGINVGTTAAIYRAICLGEPLISRFMTVTGNAILKPRNFEVLIGTSMDHLLEQCSGGEPHYDKLIMGGPMMGFALHSSRLPVIKTTNCVLALSTVSEPPATVMPCIRCGACADACPVNLLPQQLYWYSSNKDLEKTQEYNLFDCIECGCCSYVCPSKIPLVQYYRYAKGDIWIKEREKEKADLARQRFESREVRIIRRKAEHGARRKKKKERLQGKTATAQRDNKKAEIDEAIKRVSERRDKAVERANEMRGKIPSPENENKTDDSNSKQP